MLVFVSALEVSLRVRSCWLPTILLAKTTLFDAHKLRKPATEPNTAVPEILHRAVGAGGPGCMCPSPLPQFLAGNLTLRYTHQIAMCPPDFQTFLRPCYTTSILHNRTKKKLYFNFLTPELSRYILWIFFNRWSVWAISGEIVNATGSRIWLHCAIGILLYHTLLD